MTIDRTPLIWSLGLLGLPGAILAFWGCGHFAPICELTACACEPPPACDGRNYAVLPWLGFVLLTGFVWSLDKLLKSKWESYAFVSEHGNIHVDVNDENVSSAPPKAR